MTLEKLVYLVYPPAGQSRGETRALLLDECAPALLQGGARQLQINIDDEVAAETPSPAPPVLFEQPVRAQVNLWVEALEARRPLEDLLRHARLELAGYHVEEQIYTEYGGNRHAGPRDWPDGQRSPGVLLLTMMERPRRLTREQWFARWHGRQSPLSEAMQPRCRYVRNVVLQPLTPGAPPFEGIVEEDYPTARHVTDPYLFYGARSTLELAKNMASMLHSVCSFLDLWRIRTVTMSEYFLRTESTTPPSRQPG